jgi:BlaI family transcriptional regulator, penicillinase repressor
MARRKSQGKPTEAELAILGVLWSRGPSTVREVHEELQQQRESGYTTTLKMLQIMHAKGLVKREDSDRAHVFEAVPTAADAQRSIVTDLIDRVFGGSRPQLVLHAIDENVTVEEIAEIRRVLDEAEKRRQ